ncbi:sugar phosphate isomerase/epimerase [bacterium]|nr:sugar phosphate isomerase/epimerase [bacterium]
MKFSICNEMFENWKIDDVFECAAGLGYDAVEIAPFTLCNSVVDVSPSERDRIRRAAEKSKIAIAGLHWLLVSPKGLHLSHPNAEIRSKTRDYFLELIKFCSDLGGTIMVIGSPKERSVTAPLTYEQAWEYTKETYVESAQLAQERDVILCMEPLYRESTDFINTPEEAVKMIKDVNNPNFKLILDVFSSASVGIDLPAAIREHREHLAHVHTNDDNQSWPGTGGVDYPPIIEALKEINYKGYLSTEVFIFEPDPETIARESIKFLKSLI